MRIEFAEIQLEDWGGDNSSNFHTGQFGNLVTSNLSFYSHDTLFVTMSWIFISEKSFTVEFVRLLIDAVQ